MQTKKSKKDYFANITDNKDFWKTVKIFLSKNLIFLKEYNLTEEENNSLLTNFEEVENAVKSLNIPN